MTVYHVTTAKNAKRIRVVGFRTFEPTNWVDGKRKRLGDGSIYAFRSREDALRWAGKMDWDLHQDTGTGKIVILAIDAPGWMWENDNNDPLSQACSLGQWIKTHKPIPAGCVSGEEVFTPVLMREAVRVLQGRE